MLLDLESQIVRERQKRDRALRQLENSAESAADGVAEKFQEARAGMLKGVIRSAPFASCFAALGAGALVGRIATGGNSRSCAAEAPPQRVIIEIQGANGTPATPAPAPSRNPLDMIMQALTVYGAVQQSMHEMGILGNPAPARNPEAAANGNGTEQNAPTENNV